MAYYGGNDRSGNDVRPHEMIIDACRKAESMVDFTIYDRDNDGYVDLVYVIYAGYGESSNDEQGSLDDTVWPHAWYIYQGAGERVLVDGKYLDAYACSAELSGNSGTYRDEAGKYEEQVVTFWNAVDRRRASLPAIITQPQAVLQRTDLPDTFLKTLPKDKWQFVFSLQQNDMFILGMNEEDYRYAIDHHDYASLNKHLYRVQKISSMYYCFRHHIETSVDDKYGEKKREALSIEMGKLKRIRSLKALFNLNPHKVHISVLGEISEIS